MRRDATGWGFQGAEGAEIDNHEKNESWRYELLSRKPANRQLVKLTWVFKVKRDGRKKARLCVQGCTQRPGVDYDQTFCAAMRGGSLRLLSSIGGRLGLSMRRWDFVAAYLQGELEPGEVTYCSPPPGYTTAEVDGRVRLVPIGQGDGVERMCVVTKPVYGMAQAGRRWQRSLFPWLTSWNAESGEDAPRLQQSVFDTCVFFCRHSTTTPSGRRDEIMLVGVYVDDLFVLSSHTDEHSLYARFTTDLAARWDVEDEGEVTDLLSVEIERRGDHIHLGQSKYIAKLMSTYAPDGTPSSSLGASYPLSAHPHGRTPAGEDLPQHVLTAVEQSADDIDRTLLRAYQSLVGALLYCAREHAPGRRVRRGHALPCDGQADPGLVSRRAAGSLLPPPTSRHRPPLRGERPRPLRDERLGLGGETLYYRLRVHLRPRRGQLGEQEASQRRVVLVRSGDRRSQRGGEGRRLSLRVSRRARIRWAFAAPARDRQLRCARPLV